MPLSSTLTRALALSVAAITTMPITAHAIEAEAVGEALQAALARQDMGIEWTGASAEGDRVTLEGVTLKPVSDGEPLAVGTLVLDGIEEDGDDIYADTLNIPGFTKTQDGMTVEVTSLTLTNLNLGIEEGDVTTLPYDSIDLDRMVVKDATKELFVLDDLYIEATAEEGEPIGFTGRADAFRADLSGIEDPKTRAVLEAMKYTTIEGSFEMAGDWQPTDGRARLESMDVAIVNAGTISLSLDMGGYTPETLKALQEAQAKIDAAGQNDPAAGMAMLGLLQQLTFVGATVSFEDDQLTGRALDYVAGQQGAKATDIANQAKALLPFMLAQLNNPAFTAQVTEAVGKFLDDPQSLTITASPTAPVPFAMLAAGAMTAPQALPNQLGLTVTANEAE